MSYDPAITHESVMAKRVSAREIGRRKYIQACRDEREAARAAQGLPPTPAKLLPLPEYLLLQESLITNVVHIDCSRPIQDPASKNWLDNAVDVHHPISAEVRATLLEVWTKGYFQYQANLAQEGKGQFVLSQSHIMNTRAIMNGGGR